MTSTINPAPIQEFFNEASLATWAGNGEKTTITELPGSKVLRYERNGLLYVDTYFVTPNSPKSFGQTLIYSGGIPMWMMQYRGQYPEEVIPFLKQALRAQYETGEFNGGRGPSFFHPDGQDLEYTCEISRGHFWEFAGVEYIESRPDKKKSPSPLGYHEFRGFALT